MKKEKIEGHNYYSGCKLIFSPAFVYLGKVVAKMQGLYLGSNLFCALWSSNLGGNNVHQCTNEQEYAIM
jgi:hypothetical protein